LKEKYLNIYGLSKNMAKEVSNRVVIGLIIVALLISLVSTYIVYVYVGNITPITARTIEIVYGPPSQSNGDIGVIVLPNEPKRGS